MNELMKGWAIVMVRMFKIPPDSDIDLLRVDRGRVKTTNFNGSGGCKKCRDL